MPTRRKLPRRPSPKPQVTIDMVPDAKQSHAAAERKFVAGMIETGSVTKASELAGVDRRTGTRMMKRPSVLSRYQKALADAGIDDATLADRLHNALFAQKIILLPDGKGGVTEKYVDDHRTQLEAVRLVTDTALKLRTLEKMDEEDTSTLSLPEGIDQMDTVEISRLLVTRVIKRG